MDSPYHPGFGSRPAVLTGRESHISRVDAALTRVQNSGEAAPTHLVFTGPRGYGKTVTLGVAAERATARGFVVASVSLDSVSDNVQMLAAGIAEGLTPPRRSRAGATWSAVKRRLAALSIEVNAGVVKIVSDGTEHRTPTTVTVQRQTLAAVLSGAAQAARAQDRSGLVLILDELQEAPADQMVILANAVQDAGKIPRSPLVLIAAGLPQTPERIMTAASFTERFAFRSLGRLDDADAERALVEPALAVGVRWAGDAAAAALRAASGSPYLIQYIGDETWGQAVPRAGSVLPVEAVRRALADIDENLSAGMFRGRWNKATAAERSVISAIAHTTQDGIARTAHVSAALGLAAKQWSVARQSLIDKGIIEPVGYGRLRFTMPGFGAYALSRAEGDDADAPPRPDRPRRLDSGSVELPPVDSGPS